MLNLESITTSHGTAAASIALFKSLSNAEKQHLVPAHIFPVLS